MFQIHIMRTTLTIEDDVDTRLRTIADRQNRSYKDVVNEALSAGLNQMEVSEPAVGYKVRAADFGLKNGIDENKLNQLYDETEAGD